MPDAPQPFRATFGRNRKDENRITLVAIDGPLEGAFVRVHYNPQEIQFERATTWNPQSQPGAAPDLQHTKDGVRTMSLELMFDCYEVSGQTLEEELATLEAMMQAPDPEGDAEARKPPVLEIVNGPIDGFRCVIDSLAVKVTMFDRMMKPVRANVSIKLTEVANPAAAKRPARSSGRSVNYLTWVKPDVKPQVTTEEFLAMLAGLE